MPKEIESGVYLLRIKYTNRQDELVVEYERHGVHVGISDMKEILAKVTAQYERFAKSKVDITYKFLNIHR